MKAKPLYGRILVSREFERQEDARSFIAETKAQYKDSGVSIKADISRTPNSYWEVTVYAKL